MNKVAVTVHKATKEAETEKAAKATPERGSWCTWAPRSPWSAQWCLWRWRPSISTAAHGRQSYSHPTTAWSLRSNNKFTNIPRAIDTQFSWIDHRDVARNVTTQPRRAERRERALTYEGPDEADDVLREVEEREVLEPPRLRPEPLRGPEEQNPPNWSQLSLCVGVQTAFGRGMLTEFPGGRPGRCRRTRSRRRRRRGRPRAPPCSRRRPPSTWTGWALQPSQMGHDPTIERLGHDPTRLIWIYKLQILASLLDSPLFGEPSVVLEGCYISKFGQGFSQAVGVAIIWNVSVCF